MAAAVVPTEEVTDSTSESRATMAATCRWRSTSASKETPSAASVVASSCPVSSLGNRPLGAAQKSHAVATRITAENAIVPGRCSMTHARLRVYAASARSYTRSVARYKRPCVTPRSERRNRLASIGLSVSDTKPETRIETPIVTANS